MALTASQRLLGSFVRDLGYEDENLRVGYPVWTGELVEQVDLVGFGRPDPQDMTTATLVGIVAQDGGVSRAFTAARALASPAAVLVRTRVLEIWSIATTPERDKRIESAPHEEAGRLAARFQKMLGPQQLLDAKLGIRQLTLFPIDVSLLAKARHGASTVLSARIEEALARFLARPRRDATGARRLVDAARHVVGVIAALMIRDKFHVPSTSWDSVLDYSAHRFPGYFDFLSTSKEPGTVIESLFDILGEGINYEALDPGVASDVYESAVVSRSERLRLGIFYTPPQLAKSIVATLPFEELPPDQRVVLDPACGSGTLLLAAHDRLLSMMAMAGTEKSREYVRTHLLGFDRDSFAVEIARLALLVNALPAGNSWEVQQRDILRPLKSPSRPPSLIISNPPWRDIRSKGGIRHQVANDFLAQTLERVQPGGFLAVVLPAAWLSADVSAEARELVRQQTSIFEVWRLPEGTFQSASLSPCVLFAQRLQSERRYVFRRVRTPRGLGRFYENGAADERYLSFAAAGVHAATLLRGPLDLAADLIRSYPKLHSVAFVQNGPVPEPPVQERGKRGGFKWLKHAGDLIAFGEAPEDALLDVDFPKDFHRAGAHAGDVFSKEKLLLSAKRTPANPWRLKVGIDHRGVIPRESLYMVWPRVDEEGILYALLTILGSSVASSWVDSYEPKMAISSTVLHELPIPPRSGRHWTRLQSIGRQLIRSESSRLEELLLSAEEAVWDAYELPVAVRNALKRQFAGARAPEGGVRFPGSSTSQLRSPSGDRTRRFGSVLDVKEDRLLLWVPGITEEDGSWKRLPIRFLGWHCSPGATFEVVGDDLSIGDYHFQSKSYVPDEDLTLERRISRQP